VRSITPGEGVTLPRIAVDRRDRDLLRESGNLDLALFVALSEMR